MAAYLYCLSSLCCWHHQYYHEVSYIQGLANEMADIISCHHDLSNLQLLTLFNTCFPQDTPWCMCPLPPVMLSALNCSLQQRQPTTALWLLPKLDHITNIPPNHIKAYSLHSGGTTTLLISCIDQTAIYALGCWKV